MVDEHVAVTLRTRLADAALVWLSVLGLGEGIQVAGHLYIVSRVQHREVQRAPLGACQG